MPTAAVSPRERVKRALRHQQPDRTPADFLATPEVWRRLVDHLGIEAPAPGDSDLFDPAWEALLRELQIDCRVISYDQFCSPPPSACAAGAGGAAAADWWSSPGRSTPNRMWRCRTPDGLWTDVWGHSMRLVEHATGVYEEFAGWPLADATTVSDLARHPWPEPDWWDWSPLPQLICQLDQHGDDCHLRFRAGSIFESAWQLRGMERFLMDLALDPALPEAIMDRLTDLVVENTRRFLALAGDRVDMVYLYDDVATQSGLLISKAMWRRFVRPRHARIIEVAKTCGKQVMLHCDGAVGPLIPELIDLGVDLLNPIDQSASGMEPGWLKREYGDRLSFHGGIDIVQTLPRGTPQEVQAEVRERVRVLGRDGGYVLCSSHHIQPDTPIANVLAMMDVVLRLPASEEVRGWTRENAF